MEETVKRSSELSEPLSSVRREDCQTLIKDSKNKVEGNQLSRCAKFTIVILAIIGLLALGAGLALYFLVAGNFYFLLTSYILMGLPILGGIIFLVWVCKTGFLFKKPSQPTDNQLKPSKKKKNSCNASIDQQYAQMKLEFADDEKYSLVKTLFTGKFGKKERGPDDQMIWAIHTLRTQWSFCKENSDDRYFERLMQSTENKGNFIVFLEQCKQYPNIAEKEKKQFIINKGKVLNSIIHLKSDNSCKECLAPLQLAYDKNTQRLQLRIYTDPDNQQKNLVWVQVDEEGQLDTKKIYILCPLSIEIKE